VTFSYLKKPFAFPPRHLKFCYKNVKKCLGHEQLQISDYPTGIKENNFKHQAIQTTKSLSASSLPSDKLIQVEEQVLSPTGPPSSNCLPDLGTISDISSKVLTISPSKSQVGKMSQISGETPSVFSGLSDFVEAAEKEGIFNSSMSIISSSNSQAVR
jgi:hypothetical protein